MSYTCINIIQNENSVAKEEKLEHLLGRHVGFGHEQCKRKRSKESSPYMFVCLTFNQSLEVWQQHPIQFAKPSHFAV